jgi:uncharacterized metal-binding protein
MFCLAGIGAGIDSFISNTKEAEIIVTIDGCKVECAKKTLEKYGIKDFIAVDVSELGFAKGSSPSTTEI